MSLGTVIQERRKDPVKVRAALIDATATLIGKQGLGRVTVDGVARLAGVTKGGLFHHFASKDELIEGVLTTMVEKADEHIEELMAADPEPYGRFTRAYLTAVCEKRGPDAEAGRAFCLAMLGDPALSEYWTDWFERLVVKHAATDDNPRCAMVRLAADGIWLASLSKASEPPAVCVEVRAGLTALTYPPTSSDPKSS